MMFGTFALFLAYSSDVLHQADCSMIWIVWRTDMEPEGVLFALLPIASQPQATLCSGFYMDIEKSGIQPSYYIYCI
jgi:hypothetical protein